jgi:hypothetical protein
MPATWPDGVPYRVLFNGASVTDGEPAMRSPTDSGLTRQRAQFSGVLDKVQGPIRMTRAQRETFAAWRKGLGGGTFNWLGYQAGYIAVARFVAGEQGPGGADAQTGKWLVPVSIEIMSVSAV